MLANDKAGSAGSGTAATSFGAIKPLPLGPSGPHAVRGRIQKFCYYSMAALSLALAIGAPGSKGLDPFAFFALFHYSVVFTEQTWSMQFPRWDLGVCLLGAGSLTLPLAGSFLGETRTWDVRLGAAAQMCLTWLYFVRGPAYGLADGSLKGKVALITGCNAGIGFGTAKALAQAGATIVFACRSESKARQAMSELVQNSAGRVKEEQLLFICPLDLSSNHSVKSFASKFRLLASMRGLELHLLILNAGAMFSTRCLSVDNIEMTMAANHLGHFLLTKELLPHLRSSEKSGSLPRIVVMSSSHSFSQAAFDFSEIVRVGGPDGPDREEYLQRPFAMFHSYSLSKLANCLFATELTRRLREAGSRIPVCAVHPGSVVTEIARDIPWWLYRLFITISPLMYCMLKTMGQGCYSGLYAACSSEVARRGSDSPGCLWVDRCTIRSPPEASTDAEAARRLWTMSEAAVAGSMRRASK